MKYYLNIGTNLGDRHSNLMRAIALLSAGTGGCQVSSIVQSRAWGFDSPHDFLNVGVALTTSKTARQVLDWIHGIEAQLGSPCHRDAAGHYIDRLVDIDIVYIEQDTAAAAHGRHSRWQQVTIDEPGLTVPHPHHMERPFFLTPLRQLRPATFES